MALNPLFQAGPLDPDGTPQVSPEPGTLLLDAFDTALANWVTGGTVTPAVSNGNVTFGVGTTASATSYMRSIGTFRMQAGTFLIPAWIITLDTAATLTNSTRWWGYGQNQTSPSSTAPVLNGAVFVTDPTSGNLQAAVYSAGTKTFSATLTKPTDGLQHRYEIRYRQSRVYWSIDGANSGNAFGTITYPNLAVANNLYLIAGSANGSTAPSATPTLSATSSTISDLGANVKTIGDPVAPWIQASVKAATVAAATATDAALVTVLRDALPAGTNRIGNVAVTDGTNVAAVKASATAPVSTDPAVVVSLSPNSAGQFYRMTTPVARGSAAGLITASVDAEGKMVTVDGADPINTWQGNVTQTTTTAAAIKTAAASGIRNYMTDLSITNASATVVVVTVLDGSTVIWQQSLAATTGSIHRTFKTPLRGTAATAMNVNISAAATSVYFSAEGFIGV